MCTVCGVVGHYWDSSPPPPLSGGNRNSGNSMILFIELRDSDFRSGRNGKIALAFASLFYQ